MSLLEQIVELAASTEPEALGELTISVTHPELYDAALAAFGGWDLALVHALKRSLSASVPRPAPPRTPSPPVRESPAITRVADPDAMRPLFVVTETGYLLRLSPGRVAHAAHPGAPRPIDRWTELHGLPSSLIDLGHVAAVLAFADDGRAYGWDSRVVPDASEAEAARRLGEKYGVDRWAALGDRDEMAGDGLVVSVSRDGKIKTTRTDNFPSPLTSEGTLAFLVDDGDEALDVHIVRHDDHLLLASSNGYAIVFDLGDVRPMGRKAAGVKGMSLRHGAVVVGSLVPRLSSQIAMVTRRGYGKRVDLSDFRPQSRAGLGLVGAKLSRGDALTAIAGCSEAADLVILTNRGNALRLPAEAFPLMGRPARGQRVIELDGGESVVGLTALLPMAIE